MEQAADPPARRAAIDRRFRPAADALFGLSNDPDLADPDKAALLGRLAGMAEEYGRIVGGPGPADQPAPAPPADGADLWLGLIDAAPALVDGLVAAGRLEIVAEGPGLARARADLVGRLVRAMHARRRAGLARYGVPVAAHNGRDAARDCGEEFLDALVYAEQARVEGHVGGEALRMAALLSCAVWASLDLGAYRVQVGEPRADDSDTITVEGHADGG